jgi:pre-rRNA-processing protein TSR3
VDIDRGTLSLDEDSPVKLFTVEFHEDDPAKCTSAKMAKFRLARRIRMNQISSRSIVLNPFAPEIILHKDRSIIESGGLVVIDCSWVNATPHFNRGINGNQRRLPLLLAGNPTNYSKLGALSSLEASAASLYITGFQKYCARLLSLYKWGDTFESLNRDALKDYSMASDLEEIMKIELDYFPQSRTA